MVLGGPNPEYYYNHILRFYNWENNPSLARPYWIVMLRWVDFLKVIEINFPQMKGLEFENPKSLFILMTLKFLGEPNPHKIMTYEDYIKSEDFRYLRKSIFKMISKEKSAIVISLNDLHQLFEKMYQSYEGRPYDLKGQLDYWDKWRNIGLIAPYFCDSLQVFQFYEKNEY